MKVLIINTVETARNGITNVIFNHLKEFYGSDILFDMVVINKLEDKYANIIRENGGHFFELSRSIKSLIRYMCNLKTIIKKNAYDAIHIHGNSHTVIIELLAAIAGGCKTRIVHAHSTACNSQWLHKTLSGVFQKICTHRLACGSEVGQFMYENKSFEVIKNGIDVNQYSFCQIKRNEIRTEYNLENKIVLGHVGSFSQTKNQCFLIEILKELVIIDSRYRLILIGKGELVENVRKKVADLNLENYVIFVGETDDVSKYLSSMDIFLMPSLYEGLPLTLVEAQANGLGCIVSDKITKEVNISGLVKFLSIENGTEEWIYTLRTFNMEDNRAEISKESMQSIIDQGYSIQGEVKKLREYYHNAIR